MTATNVECGTLDDLVWTGVKKCPFADSCSRNQLPKNCQLVIKMQSDEVQARKADWGENDEPIAC